MRILLAIVVLGVVVAFGASGFVLDAVRDLRTDYRPSPSAGDLPGRYDQVVEVTYMARCQRDTNDVTYCRCTLEKLSAKFGQAKFEKMNARLAQNPDARLPRQAREVFDNCASAAS